MIDEFLKFVSGFLCTFLLCLVRILLATFWVAFPILAKSSSQVLCGVFEGGGGGIWVCWWDVSSWMIR